MDKSTGISNLSVEALEKIGGREWIKGDYHRVYFDAAALTEIIGLTVSLYGTGNVSSAQINGSKISNGRASKMRSELGRCKFWFDVKRGEFDARSISIELFDTIVAIIKVRIL
ncbi:Uncharacterised protein [Serratia rubidaea]|nr:Uncharacterised protein [Serratia rubidaea]